GGARGGGGGGVRLDAVRARPATGRRERLPLADDDRGLAEALDRWELSLFAEEPFRSGQVRDALTALLGGEDGFWAAAMRLAVLTAEDTKARGGGGGELCGGTGGRRETGAHRARDRGALLIRRGLAP